MTHTYIDSATTTDYQFTHAISTALEHSDFTPESLFRSLAHAEFIDLNTNPDLTQDKFLFELERFICCERPKNFSNVSKTLEVFWWHITQILAGEEVPYCECIEEVAE